jgi:tetratricopeptide (TPR) repeat protein
MKNYLFLLLTLFPLLSYSQTLKYEEDKSKADVYSNGDENTTKAAVVIESYKSLKLTFRSNVSGKLEPYSIEELGNKRLYSIEVERDQDHSNDGLVIENQEYDRLVIPLKGMLKKTKRHYLVENPEDPEGKSCYQKNKNLGDISFKETSYEKAKEEYKLALNCWDAPDDSYVKNRIQVIDSITYYKIMAEAALNLQDYKNASESYTNAYYLNINDKFLEGKRNEMELKFGQFCQACYDAAETYYRERDFVNAKIYYEKIVSQSCPNFLIAQNRIKQIEERSTQNYHVLAYEIASGTPIGLSTGNYKEHHKTSGYFSFRFNQQAFEMIRADKDEIEKMELNVSFGWTLEIHKPVWLFFGPGYTGVGEYYYKENHKEEDLPIFVVHNAISPEAGLLGKIPILGKDRIALRYTFQYRYALKKDDSDFIGQSRHVFGIGICF